MKIPAQNWLDRARSLGTPLIDDNTATFVWHGDDPPILRGDWNDWDEVNLLPWQRAKSARGKPAVGPVWTATLELAADAYVEYCLGTDQDRVADPFNPRLVSNGMGKHNHCFYMPAGAPTPLARCERRAARGVITSHDLPTHMLVSGQQRRVYLYRPPVDGPAPLVLVYDGPDYLRRASLAVLVDNLIAQQRIRPIALAMVANGRGARMAEYGGSDSTLVFIQEVVLPVARQELDLLDITEHSGAFGVIGASLGGLMALFTGLRLPHLFGHVLSQSGAFYFGPYRTTTAEIVEQGPARPVRIWMDVGCYEGLLDGNRRMAALLQSRGYDVAYREYNAGHNYAAWRDDLWRGLEVLFPWNES